MQKHFIRRKDFMLLFIPMDRDGYAVELALKYSICDFYNFNQGFPENKSEFQAYVQFLSGASLLAPAINNIMEIKIHDLDKLLYIPVKSIL